MNPYPGLRPFGEQDHEFFFGREEEIDDLLGRLTARRFIAVLGVSGCGKSSLVHAGLVPVLRSGLAEPIGGSWRIYTLAPGGAPLESLDRALGVTLERRSHALQSWAAQQNPDERILIVVDQFEEVFAYRRNTLSLDGGNAAALFVDSLITAVNDPSVPLYVVLTMRTDYLGDCALFRGLSEALNDGSYLVPRLSRLRQQDVIERPAVALGVPHRPGLVQRLLNDSEGDPDKLPVLQHLLRQLWKFRFDAPLDLELYKTVGGWEHALEQDAEIVLAQFPDEHAGIRRAFQWLAEAGTGDRPVRRRRPASELPGVTGLAPERIREILQAFAERDFLRCEPGEDGLVDFMHESVMWQWPLLQKWIQEEAEEASRIRFLQEATRRGQLLTGSTLEDAQAFRNRHASSPQWVTRYIADPAEVQRVLAWIADSQRRQKDEVLSLRRSRRWLVVGLAVAIAAVVLIAWLGWMSYQSRQAADKEIARNYWSESRSAQEKGKGAASLQFMAEAVRLQPVFERSMLLDVRGIWPQCGVVNQFQHQGAINGVKFTRDGTRILTWSWDGVVQLWDTNTGEPAWPALKHEGPVWGAQFNPDDSRILTWSADGAVRVWNAATGRLVISLPRKEFLWGAQFSHDGRHILTWSSEIITTGEFDKMGNPVGPSGDMAQVWDAVTGQPAGPPLRHIAIVRGALFSPDDSRVLTWSEDWRAHLWDTRTGIEVGPPLRPGGKVKGALFSPDSRYILTWSEGPTVHPQPLTLLTLGEARLWDARTHLPAAPVMHHQGSVNGALFNNDGSRILTWSDDHTARLWDTRTGSPVGAPLQHQDVVMGARFARDGIRILTWSADKTAQLWQTTRLWDPHFRQLSSPPLRHESGVTGARFNADETRILTSSYDGSARIWNAGTSEQIGSPLWHPGTVSGAEFSHDENRILTWGEDGTARLWELRGALPSELILVHHQRVLGARFNREETRILTWSDNNTAQLWDAHTGLPLARPLQHTSSVLGAVFSPDEKRILTWSTDHTARLWDATSGLPASPPLEHAAEVSGGEFSADGGRVLTWSYDKTARLWDTTTGQPVFPPLQHDGWVNGARFSSDGSRILTWSEDQTARLWDARTGRPALPPLQHQGSVKGAVFNRDGSRILSWGGNQAIVWDARTGKPVFPSLRHSDTVNGAAFSPDESRILTWSGAVWEAKLTGEARIWDEVTGKPAGPVFRHKDGVGGALFNHDGTRVLTWSGDGTARTWDARTDLPSGPPLQLDRISGAAFNGDESLVLTWASDGITRLWDARTSLALGPAFEHLDSVFGAQFSRDESHILTASADGTARVFPMNIDMDFPGDSVPLWLQALTSSEFDFVTREVKPLSTAAWRQARERYEKIAAEHARKCRYPEFNEYLRRHNIRRTD